MVRKIESVLITGGAGFIGMKTAARLASAGMRVVLLDNFIYQVHGNTGIFNEELRHLRKNVSVIVGDVLNPDTWRLALKDIDSVLHLAALTGTGQSMYENYNYSNVNVGATSMFLDLLPDYKDQIVKIVIASSRSIYGEGKYMAQNTGNIYYPERRDQALLKQGFFEFKDDLGNDLVPAATDEITPPNPLSTYAITKYAQEKLVLNCADALGIGAVALRYQNVYGPGQSLRNPYTGIVSIFSAAIIKDQKINVFEDGLASRDFVYIDDVVEANIKALQATNIANKAINVGTGVPVTILQVIETLAKHLNRTPKFYISGEFRSGDIRHNYADTSTMQALLGFKAQTSFDEGAKKFIKWMTGQGTILDNRELYERSLDEMRSKGLMGKGKSKI